MHHRTVRNPLLGGAAALVFVALPAILAAPASAQVDHQVGVAPTADPALAVLPGGRAFEFTGLGDDFVFVSGAQYVELPNGEARLVGLLARRADPDQRFLVDLTFQGRAPRRGAGYPPAGGPILELAPHAYSPNGGTIDPVQWVYWTSLQGTLTGLRDYRGAKLDVAQRAPVQCGLGANGRNAEYGVTAQVRATVVQQPHAFPAFAATVDGVANLDLEPKFVLHAEHAAADPTATDHVTNHAFYLGALGADWRFVAGGELEETADGTARLTGVIARPGVPDEQFFASLHFAARTNSGEVGHAPAGSPKLELKDALYAANGGPVDPHHWYYYETFGGTLTGLANYAGLAYSIQRMGPAFQVGVGANGKNLAWGGSGWLTLVRESEPEGAGFPAELVGDVNLDLDSDQSHCASKADAQAGYGQLGGHALYLEGLGADFVFQPGGQFTELADGTAVLTGLVARASDASQRFLVSATFQGRVDPADAAYPPATSPKIELAPAAYAPGGPVDVNAWHYYTSTTGTLRGQGAFLGAEVAFTRMGPSFQVGLGANGKNLRFGASGWLLLTTVAQPQNGSPFAGTFAGDFNLDLGDECRDCPRAAGVDAQATYTAGGHALYLGGLWSNFQFAPGASFQEFDDGTARLVGTAYPPRRPAARFAVDLVFRARLDPNEQGFAPAGSPKLELYAHQYAPVGPIDTETWHYYQVTEGFLFGEGTLAGALYGVSRMGPSFQVGLGASGKNLRFGASGWLNVDKLANPANGWNLPSFLQGDVNVDLDGNCP